MTAIFSLYFLCMIYCATVSSEHYYEDETLRLPLISQGSLKRKYLQKSREFITGLRSLVDNSHIPLVCMEHYVQIYSSVAEVELIQEYLNPLEASRIEAEFYFQIQLSQAFVNLEVKTNGHKLSGIILDKNQQRGKKLDENEYEVIPVAYAEILEDVHDVMRLNLGVLSPGQRIRISFRYLEQLERIEERIWKLMLLSGQFLQPVIALDDEEEYDSKENENIRRDSSSYSKATEQKNQPATKQAGWKIYGDIISEKEIDAVVSTSHELKIKTEKRMNKQHSFMYFEVNLNGSKSETQNFEMIFTEVDKIQETTAEQTQTNIAEDKAIKNNKIEAIHLSSYEQLVNSNDPSVQHTVKAFSRNNSQKYQFKENVEESVQESINYSGKITPSMRKQDSDVEETEEEVICKQTNSNEIFQNLNKDDEVEIDAKRVQDLFQQKEKSQQENQEDSQKASTKDSIISTGLAYVGYDPSDGANPYVGLIRFPALKSLAANDSQSECDSGLRQELLKKQHASINQSFLSQQVGNQLEAGLENQPGKEQNHVKRLLLIVEDIGMASSLDSLLLQKTAEELINKLEEKILLNVVLIAKAQQSTINLLPEFIQPDKPALLQQLRENMVSQDQSSYSDLETVDFSLEDILHSYFQNNGKDDSQQQSVQYRDYSVVLGSANYWNADAVLTAIGKSRNIRLMYVGIGQAVQPAFLERISQLLGEGNALSLTTQATARECSNQAEDLACQFSQNHQKNINSQISKIITQLITELHSTQISKYTILYTKNHQEFVNSISSITTTAGSLTLSPSHTIYVHFNKSFKKLLHKSARSKPESEAAMFILRAVDGENRVYESTVSVFFSQVKTTNSLHKLAAHQKIQNILSNALYRPEQAFHSQLIALNANAYDQILRIANKHSLLTEVTAFFLFDSVFLSCQKSQFQAFPPFVFRPQQPEEEHFNEFEDEQYEEDDEEDNDGSNKYNQQNIQNSRSEHNTHAQNTINPTSECQQMESPLDLQNIKFSKIRSNSHRQLAYRKKQNKLGQSLIDIFISFENHYSKISFSVILSATRSFAILLLSII